VEILKDYRVIIMIFQYFACFGTELAVSNQLAGHFRVYFQLKAGDSAVLAASFGMRNRFARPQGGMLSDCLFAKIKFSLQ
jgi:NNP family nitrate/nitrite transporter-like MFS transporter